MSIEANLRALAARWADVPAGESANFPPYVTELTQALEVEPPRLPTGALVCERAPRRPPPYVLVLDVGRTLLAWDC